MLERVRFSVVFFRLLQVLNQLNLFSEDDVDSAAEALNDVSFRPLRAEIDKNREIVLFVCLS